MEYGKMEASSSTHHPATPSHPSLLPSLSPSLHEQTPAPLHPLPAHLYAHMGHSPGTGTGIGIGMMQPPPPRPAGFPQNTPGNIGPNGNVFGSVMSGGGGAGSGGGRNVGVSPGGVGTVYASVYSGIPVFEAMIRGISVMRRTADSWVNATQILKVAGVPKSVRTRVLEKDIVIGEHEKVQGGYGKYQGTWIPFQRGQELAVQYGVAEFLAPIFDFVPSPSGNSALPYNRIGTPDNKTPGFVNYHPVATQPQFPMTMARPYNPNDVPVAPIVGYPTQFYAQGGMYDPSARRQSGEPMPLPNMDGMMGLPQSRSDVYIDQYGQPHPTYQSQLTQQYTTGDMGPPPAKRQRSDEGYTNGHEYEPPVDIEEDDADSADDIHDAPPLPAAMRLATKPLRPKQNGIAWKIRSKLLVLLATPKDTPLDVRAALDLDPDATSAADFDIDMVVDNHGHTALHWACSLARTDIASQLIELGADIHRGNFAGETPLIRSVLTTNHAESGTFTNLLEHLSPSIQTLDQAYRTVIHHIALIAGVKGRASSARAYMAGILEWIAKGNVGNVGMKNLVDVQDVHGDTALNVAARVGNRGLVKLLLDAGADKARANKLGLKPQDFGVEVDALKVSPAEVVVSNLKSEVVKPERQSKDVQKNIAAIFETINDTFAAEMTAKQTKLNATEQSVRYATRALSEKRQHVQRAQSAVSELEQARQKVENVKRAMQVVGSQDWTGRTPIPGEGVPPAAFRNTGAVSLRSDPSGDIEIPVKGEAGGLGKLRRMINWEDRIGKVLEGRTRELEGESAERAVKYRKLVSLCTKVPVDKVDGMLEGLTSAIESDGQGLDRSRISQFMNRMKESGNGSGSGSRDGASQAQVV